MREEIMEEIRLIKNNNLTQITRRKQKSMKQTKLLRKIIKSMRSMKSKINNKNLLSVKRMSI